MTKGVLSQPGSIDLTADFNYTGKFEHNGIPAGVDGAIITPSQEYHTTPMNYQMLDDEYIYIRAFVATAASVAQLPLNPMLGQECVMKDGTGSAGAWILICQATTGITIDGAASINITTNYGYFRFRWNGIEWNIIGSD